MKKLILLLSLIPILVYPATSSTSNVRITSGGYTRYDTNGVPYIKIIGTASVTAGDQSTNTIGVQSSELTNIVLLLNNQSNQITSLQASNNLISARVDAVTSQIAATPTVKGWPIFESSATLTNYLGTDLVAGDALNTNGLVFTGFTNAIILSISYLCSSNQTAVQSQSLLLTTNALTWVEATAAAAVSAAEIPYQLEHYDFGTNSLETIEGTTFRAFGNTSKCTVPGKSAVTPPGITTLYGYLKTRAAITNVANDIIRIRYQNSY